MRRVFEERCLRHREFGRTRHPQTGAAEQPWLLLGNLLKIQWLAASHFKQSAAQKLWFPYGNLFILWGEFDALPSHQIYQHESH